MLHFDADEIVRGVRIFDNVKFRTRGHDLDQTRCRVGSVIDTETLTGVKGIDQCGAAGGAEVTRARVERTAEPAIDELCSPGLIVCADGLIGGRIRSGSDPFRITSLYGPRGIGFWNSPFFFL